MLVKTGSIIKRSGFRINENITFGEYLNATYEKKFRKIILQILINNRCRTHYLPQNLNYNGLTRLIDNQELFLNN